MKASEHLAAARDEIVKGWTKGTIQDSNGSVCSVGAIHRVAEQNKQATLDGFVDNCQAGNEAAAELKRKVQVITGRDVRIEGFNDDDSTELQDVLNAFDKAISGLEERGE